MQDYNIYCVTYIPPCLRLVTLCARKPCSNYSSFREMSNDQPTPSLQDNQLHKNGSVEI